MASSATQSKALPMEAPKSTVAADEITNINNKNNSTNGSSIKQRQLKQQQIFLKLDQLPDLVIDKILDLLEPQDLRSIYQVCKAWKNILCRRPHTDSRRVELVTKIRLNKENIARGCSLDSATPSSKINGGAKSHAHDGKPGSRSILRTVSNSRPNLSITSTKKPLPRSISTPTSRFLQEYETGTKLLHGQILFRCPKCTGPVPSPIATSTRQQHKGGFRQMKMTDTFSTPQTQSSIASSPASNITEDSGIEISLDVSQDDYHSMVSVDNDTTTQDHVLSLGFIASPPSTVDRKSTETGRKLERIPILEHSIDSELNFSSYNASSSSNNSSMNEHQLEEERGNTESIQCPKCSHRFCCHCQCTEHSGRPCKEISGDSFAENNLGSTNNESTTLKSDKAKRSKKALRRLARV